MLCVRIEFRQKPETLACNVPLAAFFAAVVLVVSLGAMAQAASPMTVEKVVIVQRHGVRAPTKSSETLSQYSRDPWRVWPVPPGELTMHGADGATAMGKAIGRHYDGLLGLRGCEGIFVWADAGSRRTRQSADAAAAGLRPGCSLKAVVAEAAVDPLFSPDKAGLCPHNAAEDSKELGRLGPDYERARKILAAVLDPDASPAKCKTSAAGVCLFWTGENRFVEADGQVRLSGPLAIGSSLSENLLLEYAQGFDRVGWGRAYSEKKLAQILVLHNLYARLTRQTPNIAGRNGAAMAAEIAGLLAPSNGLPMVVAVPAEARLTLFLGHDGNLSNLAGIYGFDWRLPGQPDVTAPNTALAFERVRDFRGNRYVRVALFYQTLAEMRRASPRVRRISLRMPGCHDGPDGSCPLPRFVAETSGHIRSDCLPER